MRLLKLISDRSTLIGSVSPNAARKRDGTISVWFGRETTRTRHKLELTKTEALGLANLLTKYATTTHPWTTEN